MGKLYRLSEGKIVAGVCQGMAQYLEVDVILVRLAWVALALASGAGVIAYIIAWIVIPPAPMAFERSKPAAGNAGMPGEGETSHGTGALFTEVIDVQARDRRRRHIGLLLVVVGAIFLAGQIMPTFIWAKFWPLMIIALGVVLLQGRR